MNLYTIKREYQELIDRAENSSSEEFEVLESELIINQEQFKEKALAYTHVIKNTESDISGIDAEIKRLQGLKSSKVNLVEKLEKNIVEAMVMFESEKLDFGTFKLSTRKSESVDTSEAEKFIKENGFENAKDEGFDFGGLYSQKISYAPDKKEIKDLLKNGIELKGCALVQKKSLQIK